MNHARTTMAGHFVPEVVDQKHPCVTTHEVCHLGQLAVLPFPCPDRVRPPEPLTALDRPPLLLLGELLWAHPAPQARTSDWELS